MSEGVKYDKEKPRYDLIDAYALDQLAQVLTFGAKKYDAHNWKKGLSYGRLLAAAFRHLFAILRGEETDIETGLPHAAHAMCCCMFLVWTMKYRKDMDDRWKDAIQPQTQPCSVRDSDPTEDFTVHPYSATSFFK